MTFSLKKNKYVKYTTIILSTAALFALVSYLSLYITEFKNDSIWTFLGSSDNRFHMMRIEGLYHSLLRHQYFPFINMSFLDGFGYISSIFYSDFLIYPVAIMRVMGYTASQAIIRYYLLLNFLTFVVSFLCYYKVQKKYWNSLVFSFIYTLSNYRLHDLLFRHDLGEVGAFLFLPIAVLGIYEIFYGNRKNWLYLTFGMTAIIYSHAISPILVAILIIAVGLLQIGELKEHPKRLLSLLWATISSGFLSIAYFLPMIEQMKHTTFVLTESKGILPAGALNFSDAFTYSLNNVITDPSIGLIMLLTSIIVLISYKKIQNRAVKHFAIIGVVMFICSSKVFPWFILNTTMLKSIQYPWRFYMISTILLAVFVAYDPLKFINTRALKIVFISFTFLLTLSSIYRLASSSQSYVPYATYNQPSPYSIGAGHEYLPINTDFDKLQTASHKPKIITGKANISNFKQYGTRLSFDFKNAKNTKVNLPIIGYYGFQSKQSVGKVSKLTMDKSHNNLAQVTINGKGKVVVDYFETTIQKFARRTSFLSLLIIIAGLIVKQLDLKLIKSFKKENI